MRNALLHFREIEEGLRAARPLLLLDFDGTLSPIAPTPGEARLLASTKRILRSLGRRTDIVVISGRSASNVRKKVGLRGIEYAGDHGLEWHLSGNKGNARVSAHVRKKLSSFYRACVPLSRTYHGLLLEKKRFTLALHYRLVSAPLCKRLAREILATLKGIDDGRDLQMLRGKKVLEVRPSIQWTKGELALRILRRYKRPLSAVIYMGDDTTDEDAFRALAGATTVCVGNSKRSAARYFIARRSAVDTFLTRIAKSLTV